MEFRPPEACVAIRRIESLDTPRGSKTPAEGEVVAVGPGAEFLPPELEVGARVMFGDAVGTEIEVGGEVLIVLKEAEILRVGGKSTPQIAS